MQIGIYFADKIVTVSPRYAQEVRYTKEGYGLQSVINARGGDFIGILNGVDYTVWNPEVDDKIYANYSLKDMHGKLTNKYHFLKDWGIDERDMQQDMPIIGMVTRLTDQKGIPLVQNALEGILRNYPVRFALVGTGADQYENYFRSIRQQFGDRALVYIGYNDNLSHRVEAASDIYLMPSLFEPCGLNQMYSLKYGTVPVVRNVGGLADTVHEYDFSSGEGNGFVFDDYNAGEMGYAVHRAIEAYFNKPHWSRVMRNGMMANHSSLLCAQQYVDVFYWALEKIPY
jgi:starch synthase